MDYNSKNNLHGSWGPSEADGVVLSAEKVEAAVEAGLAGAATKAKLFADHDEREIQRLSANIINHQVSLLLIIFSFSSHICLFFHFLFYSLFYVCDCVSWH